QGLRVNVLIGFLQERFVAGDDGVQDTRWIVGVLGLKFQIEDVVRRAASPHLENSVDRQGVGNRFSQILFTFEARKSLKIALENGLIDNSRAGDDDLVSRQVIFHL